LAPVAEALRPEDILDFEMISDAQLSPDGSQVAFVRIKMDRVANEQKATIWAVVTDGATPLRQLTAGPRRDQRPRWSPDGRRLAFLSNRDREWASDLYLVDLGGGEPRRVASLPRGIEDFSWSPGSDAVALLGRPDYPEDADRDPPKDAEEARKRYQERVRYVSRFRYRLDGSGLLDDEPRRIWICDLDGQPPRALTDGPWEVLRPRWTPAGEIAFLSNRSDDHETSEAVDVWKVARSGGEPVRVTSKTRPTAAYAFGPAGIPAIVGEVEADDAFSGRHHRLFVGEQCVTCGLDRSVASVVLMDTIPVGEVLDPVWSQDGREIVFQVSDGGGVHLYRVREGAAPEPLVAGRRCVPFFTYRAGVLAFISTAPDDPVSLRISSADGSNEKVLFDPNPWVKKRAIGKLTVQPVAVFGREIDGWMITPPGYKKGTRVPTLLYIHGGPHAAYGWTFPFVFQILAGAGYAIVFCNPPGSGSYTEDFATEVHAAWGEVDFPFFMAAVDKAVAAGVADPDRLGVGGASYGGFSTLWVVTHSSRFKAAVSARPVSDLHSFHGVSDIGWIFSKREFKVDPWEDPARYWHFSPVSHLRSVTTPLRLIACLSDFRTPYGQAEEVFTMLKRMGKETDLVLFHGESHAVVVQGKPWNRVRHMRAVLEWFDRYLKSS
jgi:dipeptidyl aminopeptidase/acylaminoacyl peptidase